MAIHDTVMLSKFYFKFDFENLFDREIKIKSRLHRFAVEKYNAVYPAMKPRRKQRSSAVLLQSETA